MNRYIVFDVETPNKNNDRISAIGISVMKDGEIVDSFFSYVNPETEFDQFNIDLTGISPETVSSAPTFPELWEQIEPIMSSGVLVAHFAEFDLGVLKSCFDAYGIHWKPVVPYLCTVEMGRSLLPDISHKLNNMCEYYGIELDHHQADSDARAAAEILLRYIQDGAIIPEFVKTYPF